jgi:radical SAM superfamily enzyme YgiQ (UPF0313 family)
MAYIPPLFRPPSEAHSFILQATLGCSWNNCTYCDMYRTKTFTVQPLADSLAAIAEAGRAAGRYVEKVFVADGDALIMSLDHWLPILSACRATFPRLRQISCYAMASNVLEKTPQELKILRQAGLSLLYMGPESGDEITMRRIAKGARPAQAKRDDNYLFDSHVHAAEMTHAAGMKLSAIFLLGAGGVERSAEHAHASAELATAMDPEFLAALTLTVVPGTPLSKTMAHSGWVLPDVEELLGELRIILDESRPTNALFRTNHASNYLPLGGRLPQDRVRLVRVLDQALSGAVPLRPEWSRGL